jgi:hypothetical protein
VSCSTGEQVGAAPSIEEEVLAFGDVLDVDLTASVDPRKNALRS